MIDIQLLRDDPDAFQRAFLRRGFSVDASALFALDKELRDIIRLEQDKQARRNKVSAQIPLMKKAGEDVSEVLTEMKGLSDEIKELEAKHATMAAELERQLSELPNIVDSDVPDGGKEANVVVRTFGTAPEFSFPTKDHVQLATNLGIIDYERGVKIGGAGTWLYGPIGARLEWALLNYFIKAHLEARFEFLLPPHVLLYASGYTAGQFPKFEDDVFWLHGSRTPTDESSDKFLLPTAETALANVYRDEILSEDELPKKFFAYTPCYRREAGSYRASERGMIRGHQFNKVELFSYCTPEQSDAVHEEFITQAESLVQGLGLHYQLSLLAAQDTGPAMAKTYDIEIWIPSMNEYKEISSASNVRDYQARRGKIRYRCNASSKNRFVHTLNASGLATSRLIPALLEQNQTEDGCVRVPKILQEAMGTDLLCPF